ncbi:OPA3-like protein [Hypsizygus marmoreus]|uniref:OPA3-like protein n=1 Tax=Hypsizygus marmoreus TaxID=39966 RepID=A0A369JGF9_HYPMA|nr:OPA3-like protein [Hypsizygus marmoreus]
MGEPAKHIRPLSEARAIENGANALAEGFLFAVAASLILGETWRTSRNQSKRRDSVDDQLDALGTKVVELTTRVDSLSTQWENELRDEKQRNDELSRILQRVVEIGLRGGWAEFEDTPLQIPRIQVSSYQPPSDSPHSSSELPPEDTQIDVNTQTPSSDSSPSPPSSKDRPS